VALTDVDNLADGQRVTLQGATRAAGRGKETDGKDAAAKDAGAPAVPADETGDKPRNARSPEESTVAPADQPPAKTATSEAAVKAPAKDRE